jgi:hypothetical protein
LEAFSKKLLARKPFQKRLERKPFQKKFYRKQRDGVINRRNGFGPTVACIGKKAILIHHIICLKYIKKEKREELASIRGRSSPA